MILNTIVIDDEPLAAALITKYVERTEELNLCGTFTSPAEAIRTVLEGDIRLALLDIRMPGLNGVEFVRCLPPTTSVVFTTAFPEYAIEGIKADAVDYLLKPISYEDFRDAIDHVIKRQDMMQRAEKVSDTAASGHLLVKSDYKRLQIPLDDILYIEGLKDYVKIVTTSAPKPIMTLMSMKSLVETLPHDSFMRVHRSWIINTRHIEKVERAHVTVGGKSIPVSTSYKDAFATYIALHSPLR